MRLKGKDGPQDTVPKRGRPRRLSDLELCSCDCPQQTEGTARTTVPLGHLLLGAHTRSCLYLLVRQQLPLDLKGCPGPLALLRAMATQTRAPSALQLMRLHLVTHPVMFSFASRHHLPVDKQTASPG